MINLPKVSGIYKITNTKTNQIYIGSSLNVRKRTREHFSKLRNNIHPNLHIQSSFDKYGERAFRAELVAKCPPEYNYKLEQYFLDTLIDWDKDFNKGVLAHAINKQSSYMFTETEFSIIVNMINGGCTSRQIVSRFPKTCTHRLSKILNKSHYRRYKITKELKDKFNSNNKVNKSNTLRHPPLLYSKVKYILSFTTSKTMTEKILNLGKDAVYSITQGRDYKDQKMILSLEERLTLHKLLKSYSKDTRWGRADSFYKRYI